MYEFFEENKKTIIIIIILVLATIVISVASLIVGDKPKNPTPEESMKELASMYYEDLYYEKLVETYPDGYLTYLEQNSENGIKITLTDIIAEIPEVNLDVYSDKNGAAICEFPHTYAIITPYDPYEKEDYSIEVHAECIKERK